MLPDNGDACTDSALHVFRLHMEYSVLCMEYAVLLCVPHVV